MKTLIITYANGDTENIKFARTELDELGVLRVWPRQGYSAHRCFPIANLRSWEYAS